jgi:malonyl CoA-acyl carrier protein transacylase
MIAFVFPGQGSLTRGMGRGLFEEVTEFTSCEREIDLCLGYSVRTLCLTDPDNRLKQTEYTQPCLYLVNALHYYKARTAGERPSFVAGHSVGEYNALLAAGAFDLLTGLRLVKKRGELMAQARNGGMAAIIGLDVDRIVALIEDHGLTTLDVANYNSPVQTVVSGPVDDLRRAEPIFTSAGARMYMPLPVSAAFHSRYMAPAREAFGAFLGSFTFEPLKIPVMSNVTGQLYPPGDPTGTIRRLLKAHITSPVRWSQSVQGLLARGVTTFREIGPGMVLTKLVQQIRQATQPLASAGA